MCLICQKQENVWPAWEALVREAERDRRFAQRLADASRRVLKAKGKLLGGRHSRPTPSPSAGTVERLQRELWELNEQARLEAINAKGPA
jgi:hypothetical protein